MTKSAFFENHDGYYAAAMQFCRKNRWKLSDTARTYLPVQEIQSSGSVDDYIDRMIDHIFGTEIDVQTRLERLQMYTKFVDFFYDCYVAWSSFMREVNALQTYAGSKGYCIACWYLDDIPGIICEGSQDFKNCEFGKYPGFSETNLISEDDIKPLRYKSDEE